ncbi:hypothetical protein ColTof4_08074 [Colletotrichum tofieldiae]|uniref:Uncharacterized protein n=1 Tax=Colletotrichum tofieldiae TaxID=708197 RepID=A0A166UKF3_9PEZI|nr:hypothetical protein CT0861_03218 [Colletotrichum tofieldiae]GKT55065.1 hypothetical protein ColTof3_02404 [Colletotrichum tofieldiae]GKT75651.1 hypothetical protein ColTof4_08074 [Colletotrichum tofieldiae]GKT83337.1 hypothetical protein Ct61P_01187 [Colletotrichum tofieldiae]
MGLFKSANPTPATGAVPRSLTGQSIRGKISGPIPIPSPSDDEFPMRNPGTGIATPLAGGDMKEQQLHPPQPEPRAGSIVSVAQPEVSQAPRTDSVVAPTGSAGSGSTSPPTSGAHANSPQSQRRTNGSSHLRYSAVSASSEQTGGSRDRPQRKKSTLRGALGKLFGRKKKTGSQGSTDSQRISTYNTSNQQHKSDISALSRVNEAEPKRSASLPITEYDRALRSHSIGPQDITAIESARNSISVDLSVLGHRRAATATTSQIYSAPFRSRESEFAGLSPRPASTHVRGSRLFVDDDDPEEIGRAITSDVGQKRRSRSLSGLQNPEVRADLRRRSDEIRYWRESYGPAFVASPASSNPPDHEQHFTGAVSMDVPDSPVEHGQQQVHTPPQPFSFGNLTHMNVMAGMKITQAASIETRIETLEERMHRVEDVVTQLCNSVPGFQMHANQPRHPAPSVPGSDPSSQTTNTAVNPALQQLSRQDASASRYSSSAHSKESRTSFGEAPTYVGSLQFPAPMNRPTSNSTIRGVTSLPAISQIEASRTTGTFTADHYTMLLALLETERASRQALESQVKKLTRRLNMISGPGGYGRMSLQMEPPPTAKSFGSVSAFDQDSSDDEASCRNRRFLAEDSGVGTGPGDEDSYSEVFATPREEQPYGYGAFGEELRDEDEDPQRKKAARTLSLSQMTLSKKTSGTAVRI